MKRLFPPGAAVPCPCGWATADEHRPERHAGSHTMPSAEEIECTSATQQRAAFCSSHIHPWSRLAGCHRLPHVNMSTPLLHTMTRLSGLCSTTSGRYQPSPYCLSSLDPLCVPMAAFAEPVCPITHGKTRRVGTACSHGLCKSFIRASLPVV